MPFTTGQEPLQRKRFVQLASGKAMLVDTYRYKLFKKPKGALGKRFLSARVVDLWNGLNDSTVAVDPESRSRILIATTMVSLVFIKV